MSDDCLRKIALAMLTESGTSRFRCLSPCDLSQSERNASALLRLLAVVKEIGFDDDEYAIAYSLASITPHEMVAFELALEAIGDTRWHRALRISSRALLQQLEAASGDDRVAELLLRIERHDKLIRRLLFWTGDIIGDIEKALAHYLDNQRDVPCWQRKPALAAPHDTIQTSVATFFSGCGGDFFVFLLRDSDALAPAVDEWLRAQRRAECFTAHGRKPARAYPHSHERGWLHGIPQGIAIGRLRDEREQWIPTVEELRGRYLDLAITKLAAHYNWVLVKWPNTMHESAIAWISSDSKLASAWERTLRQHGGEQELIASYWHLDSLQKRARGVQFGESDGYGEAALVAAYGEPWPPWILVEAGESSGHSWRRHTARLTVGAVAAARTRGSPVFVGAYRVNDLAAYRALWRDMERNDGIVRATVCGCDDPTRVLQSFVSVGFRTGFHESNLLSHRHGWAYTHVYGGSSDEYHAMFHAQDPAITNRVADHAATQPNWYLCGRW